MPGLSREKKDGLNETNRADSRRSSRKVYDEKLFEAVERAQTGVIRDLLGERQGGAVRQAKANINARNKDGLTPLVLAARNRNFVVMKVLLRAGSNPNFRESQKGVTPLHFIAEVGDVESLKLLLAYRAEIDLPDVAGCTPLHYAANRKNLDATDLLIFCGADASRPDQRGITPISACSDEVLRKTLQESRHIQHGLLNRYIIIEHAELASDDTFYLENIGLTIHTRPLFGMAVKDRFDCFSISFLCRRIRPEYSKTNILRPKSKELLLSDTFEWRMSDTRGDGTVDLEIPIYEPPDPFEDIFIKTDIKPDVDDSCKLDRYRRIPDTNKWVCWATVDLKNTTAFVLVTKPKVEYCNFKPMSKGGRFKSSVDDFVIIDFKEDTFSDEGDVSLEVTPCPKYREDEFKTVMSCSHFYDINHTKNEQPKKKVNITLPVPRDYDGDGNLFVLAGNLVEEDGDFDYDEDGFIIENYNWEMLKKDIKTNSGKITFEASHFTTMAITEAAPGSPEETIKEETERIARKARKRQANAVIITMLKPTPDPKEFDVVVECTRSTHKRVLDRTDHWLNEDFRDQKPSVSEEFRTFPSKPYSIRVSGNAKKIVPNTPEAVLEYHPHRENSTKFRVERENLESNDPTAVVNFYDTAWRPDSNDTPVTKVRIVLSGTFITQQEVEATEDMAFKGFTNDKLLRYLSETLGEEWVQVCILLGLSYQKVEGIRLDVNIKEPNDRKFKALRMWRELSRHREETYGVPELLSALRRSERNDIVDELHTRLKNWLEDKKEERDLFYGWLEDMVNTPDMTAKEDDLEPMSDQFCVMLAKRVSNLKDLGPMLYLTKPEMDNIFVDSLISSNEHKLLKMLIRACEKHTRSKALVYLLEGMEIFHLKEDRDWVIQITKQWLDGVHPEQIDFEHRLIEILTDIGEYGEEEEEKHDREK
ncbi:hypothetical protein ScPMuIL_006881 [Solemya velum]